MGPGAPFNTADFSVTAWSGSRLFVFDGETLSGVLPSRLWLGSPTLDGQGDAIYLWEEASSGGPAGRKGSVLVPDLARNRLLLLLGQSEAGAVTDGWSYRFDTHAWSRETLLVPGFTARSHAGSSTGLGKIYLFGGRNGDLIFDGLYEIDLASLEGRRLDVGMSPGARAGAALRFVPRTGKGPDQLLATGSRSLQGASSRL